VNKLPVALVVLVFTQPAVEATLTGCLSTKGQLGTFMRKVSVIAAVLLLLSGAAQALVICTMPDGKTFAGDKAPPGCAVKSEFQAPPNEPPAPEGLDASREEADDGFSVKASRARTEIERTLNEDAARLKGIRETIEKVRNTEPQGDPNFLATQQDFADLANFQNRKSETSRDLKAEERKNLASIVDQWKAFDELNARVVERYGGHEPDWWRSTLRCPICPSRYEAESALK
jgi:hypothetical protein